MVRRKMVTPGFYIIMGLVLLVPASLVFTQTPTNQYAPTLPRTFGLAHTVSIHSAGTGR
jgi:hypothetical protein